MSCKKHPSEWKQVIYCFEKCRWQIAPGCSITTLTRVKSSPVVENNITPSINNTGRKPGVWTVVSPSPSRSGSHISLEYETSLDVMTMARFQT